MKYTDLIPGEIYKGTIPTGYTEWIFKYTPHTLKTKLDILCHRGLLVNKGTNKIFERGILYDLSNSHFWTFSIPTEEEIALLNIEKQLSYEIY